MLKVQISNLAHQVRHDADVLVIGSGGGTDVRSALVFNDKSVTGVEINPLVLHFANDIFGDYTGHMDRDPRVKFVNDEARSYIARTDKKYDIMQISLIDTWAAQGAGRVRAQRELAVHDQRVAALLQSPEAGRRPLRHPLLPVPRRRQAARDVPDHGARGAGAHQHRRQEPA